MSTYRTALLSILFVCSLSISVFAQTAPVKSVLINTTAFYDEKAGITKLIKASADLNTEFAVDLKTLKENNVKLRALATEIEGLQKQPVTTAIQSTIAAKQAEGESLQRTIDYNKTDLEARVARRREAVIGPITFDIGKAIAEFGKKNGYGAIFDASKLEESGVLLFVADSADITKEFIAFYNARVPAK